MPFTDGGSLQALADRIAAVRAEIAPTMQAAASEIGDEVVTQLSAAAPVGQYADPPVGDDAPGRLNESFNAFVEGGEGDVMVTVETNQANKLRFVVEGRGPVYPVTKQALFWEGLDHPVMSAGPAAPNDFVTPVTNEANSIAGTIMHDALSALMDTL